MFWATPVGFTRLFVSTTVIVPLLLVVTTAVALTGIPPDSVAPEAVENVNVSANAAALIKTSIAAKTTRNFFIFSSFESVWKRRSGLFPDLTFPHSRCYVVQSGGRNTDLVS